jgi:hypothetical protein
MTAQLKLLLVMACAMTLTACQNSSSDDKPASASQAADESSNETAAAQWQPKKAALMTRWAKDVSPKNAHPEYPRPQMTRKDWLNLNGIWDYAIAPKDAPAPAPQKYEGKILVPFPIESALSGVMKPVGKDNRLWYRRTFKVPASWEGQRVILNFGAVDWDATVLVN